MADLDETSAQGKGEAATGWVSVPRGPLRAWAAAALLLGIVAVVLAVFYVWLRVQQVQEGYHLANLQGEHEQHLVVQRKLRLEWTQMLDPLSLEELGRRQFGLAPPRQEQRLLLR
jgi:hypothetical protein